MDEEIFIDEKLSQTTDLLRHLVENSDQMPLILGEPGSGKTTLLQHFSNLAADEWELCLVEATPMLQPDQLLAHLGRCFGVLDGESPILEKILQRLRDINREGRLPIILVDDAHQLPVATIISLLRLYERHPSEQLFVKIVLFARPQIDLLLKMPQIQAMNLQIIQALDLSPMSKGRVEHFIRFLIGQMDLASSFKLSQGQLNRIYRVSGGNQRRVESELRQLLNRGSGTDRGKRGLSPLINRSAPVLIGGVLMAALILTVILFQDDINALFEVKEATESVQADQSRTTPIPEVPPLPSFTSDTMPDQAHDLGPATQPSLVEKGEDSSREEMPGVIQEPMVSERPKIQIPEWSDRNAFPTAGGDQEIDQPNETDALPETRTIGEDSSAIIKATSALKRGEPLVQDGPADSTQIVKSEVASQLPTLPALPIEPDSAKMMPLREAWLLEQNPASFTLQLVGLQSEKGVVQFIVQHKLSDGVAYFRTNREGKPWFSVLFGIYPDKGSAVAAIKALPKTLQNSDAWPRSLKSIQLLLQKQ